MINLSNIVERLNEGKQVGTVYHFTSLKNAIDILNDDFLKAYKDSDFKKDANTGMANQSNFNKEYSDRFVVSTTRNRKFIDNTHGIRRYISGTDVGLMLDGDKLSNTFKTIPFNYFQHSSKIDLDDVESEQSWFGKQIQRKRGIDNISKYIIGIIITDQLMYNVQRKYDLGQIDRIKDYPEYIMQLDTYNYKIEDANKQKLTSSDINTIAIEIEELVKDKL